ncbi:MAG TPA: hypothetical protein EYP62_08055 [Kiritimatiellae bacterium]|nr:hypothetical protein [Kiritimatiellia bacterium]
MKVVHVCANPKPIEESASKQLAAAFFETLTEKNPEVEIDNIDLYNEPPPFLSAQALRALYYPSVDPGYQPTEEERRACEYAVQQASRIRDGDVLVFTTPMWNFSLPGIVKAWIDQVFSPGILFQFEGITVKPLHSIGRAFLLAASGGVYKEDDPRDALTRQLRALLEFVGIPELSVAWADGQNPAIYGDSDQRRELALEAARELAEELAETLAART